VYSSKCVPKESLKKRQNNNTKLFYKIDINAFRNGSVFFVL